MAGSMKPQVIEIGQVFSVSFSAILFSRVLTVLTDYHANLAHRNMESPPVEVEPSREATCWLGTCGGWCKLSTIKNLLTIEFSLIRPY